MRNRFIRVKPAYVYMNSKTTFWTATAAYYISATLAVTNNPLYLFISLTMIPAITNGAELIPGMKTVLNAQIQTLQTMIWLDRKQYYEDLQ